MIVPTSAANVTSCMISGSSPRCASTCCDTQCASPNAAIIAMPNPVSGMGPMEKLNGW